MPPRQPKNIGGKSRSFQSEEEEAFDSFFRQYYTGLCFFANSIIHNEDDSKDIVQTCFIKLWDSHSIQDRSETVKSFLYSSVRNACIDFIRKKEVKEKAKLQHAAVDQADDTHFDELAFSEMMRLIMDQIHKLPLIMQQVVKMHYLDGRKYSEIAEDLHTSPDAVRMQKTRAIKMIRQKLLFFICFFLFS